MEGIWQKKDHSLKNDSEPVIKQTETTFNSEPIKSTFTQQPVNYHFTTRRDVNCITVDVVDWNDLKNDVKGLDFKASMVDAPSIFFGLAIPMILEIFYLCYSNPKTELKEVLGRLALSIIFIVLGCLAKKTSKAKHPEALEENLNTLNNRINSIEKKCPYNKSDKD